MKFIPIPLLLALSLIGCNSLPKTPPVSQKIYVSIDHVEWKPNQPRPNREKKRLQIETALVPNEKSVVGEIPNRSETAPNNPAPPLVFSLTAEPTGDQILFILERNGKVISKIQTSNRPGDRGYVSYSGGETTVKIKK